MSPGTYPRLPDRDRQDGRSRGTKQEKSRIRTELLIARRALSSERRNAAADELLPRIVAALAGARTVAAHVPFGPEPCGHAVPSLPDVLDRGGLRVLLPVLLPDGDLDWAAYDGRLTPGARGVPEPLGRRLGRSAVANVDAVVAPAVAVDRAGVRLGRGGGSYDRALARVPSGVPVIVPLYDGEVLDRLPAEPHDVTVTAVVTPIGGFLTLPAGS